ncbi:MAG TPA: hypothetical protein VK716_01160 [Terracidiphilus sp.]|nr:hypothetical protein [Terracidiphilus sp.]
MTICNLLQFSVGNLAGKYVIWGRHQDRCNFARSTEFIAAYIYQLTLGKPQNEERAMSSSVGNECAVASGTSFAAASHSLLHESPAKVGVDQATFGSLDGVKQARVGYSLTPGESSHPFCEVNLHGPN